MSLVEPGQVFRFVTVDLDLTLLVVELVGFDENRAQTRVLILDGARTVPGFRALVGQTTDWNFNKLDGEWLHMTRLW